MGDGVGMRAVVGTGKGVTVGIGDCACEACRVCVHARICVGLGLV